MRIGIDFGTTFSLPAGMINGKPETLLPNGEYGIPSVFYYHSETGVQIGQPAVDSAEIDPANAKREIKMDINQHDNGFNADGRNFSRKEIVGYIFKEIARVAQDETSRRALSSQNIDGVVISIPAAFTFREQEFIRNAAENGAGLKVLGFIREPVAAAISYFNAPSGEDQKTILVYDLGGGTCDVAIVRSDKKSNEWYKVLDSEMARIGGRDWDQILVNLIKRKIREQESKIRFDDQAEEDILSAALKIKFSLSRLNSAKAGIRISRKLYSVAVTREEFERASFEILQSTMKIVDNMKRKFNGKIDYIVCVGGSSNMPQVRNFFEKHYPDVPTKIYEPEKAIAFGAAIYAENLTEDKFLRDFCKFSYGARYIEDFEKYHDENRLRIFNIIYKNTKLPASGESSSWKIDASNSTYIAIYESENTSDNYMPSDGTYIGDIEIKDLRGAKKDDETLLTMTIDKGNMMHLKAVDQRTGKSAEVDIHLQDY